MEIDFSVEAEHVGVIRSINQNTSHLFHSIVSHVGSILHSGAAYNHRGNLAGVTKVEKLYALPVLLSGTASLNLTKAEENNLDHHYTATLKERLAIHNRRVDLLVHLKFNCFILIINICYCEEYTPLYIIVRVSKS